MRSWLRLTLLTMTIGGGFCGIATTWQLLFSPQIQGPGLATICAAFLLLNTFVLTSGLLFVNNPQKTMPLVISLALQVPMVSSPIIAYQVVTGLGVVTGMSDGNLFATVRLGSLWEFYLLQQHPWGIGLNLVPIFLLVAMRWSIIRSGKS